MTAGEFNELAKQGRVWAKIVANFSGEYGLVEKISGLTNQCVWTLKLENRERISG